MQKHHGFIYRLCLLALVVVAFCAWTTVALATGLVDGLGRQVVIEQAPERIITLPVWAAEMLLEMVGSERIIAVSAWGDDPAVSPTSELAAAVPERVSSDNAEGILALAPDLVVLDTFSAGFDGGLVRTLEEAGLTVLVMASPTDINTVMYALTMLGEATAAQEQAAQMVADMQGVLATVAIGLSKVPQGGFKTMMFYEGSFEHADMLCAYGPGTTLDAIARAAGLINVCDAPNFSPVSKEKIVAEWKPEVLIVRSSTMDENWVMNDDGGIANIAAVLADPVLAGLPAVQNQMVFAISDRYRDSQSHYIVRAVYELAKLLYPIE
ncbi:MAG: ABC transporter substrate-binding protein [Clostridia bacterium]|nr:ABC transporter substrate-binding protein [Clostridia bacterium]